MQYCVICHIPKDDWIISLIKEVEEYSSGRAKMFVTGELSPFISENIHINSSWQAEYEIEKKIY